MTDAVGINEGLLETSPSYLKEVRVWVGRPSQLANLPTYILLLILLLVGLLLAIGAHDYMPPEYVGYQYAWIPLVFLYGFGKWRGISRVEFELTNQRLKKSHGVLVRRHDEMELYRVLECIVKRPLHLLLLGYGHILIETSDCNRKGIRLVAVRKPKQIAEKILKQAELSKRAQSIAEFDIPG